MRVEHTHTERVIMLLDSADTFVVNANLPDERHTTRRFEVTLVTADKVTANDGREPGYVITAHGNEQDPFRCSAAQWISFGTLKNFPEMPVAVKELVSNVTGWF